MAVITVKVDLNPPTVAAARRQWQAALAAAERAESVYNASIERAADTVADMAARPTGVHLDGIGADEVTEVGDES